MIQQFDYPVRAICAEGAIVGESPVWSQREQALYWVDILKPALYRFATLTGQHSSWDAPAAIGSIGLAKNGKIVAALRSGFHWFDPADASWTLIAHPEPHIPHNRLNDGKTGPDGAFWAGTMDDRADKQACASLYRLAPDGSIRVHGNGLVVSNGLAWSPDGRTMYHSDSRRAVIYRYDFDAASGTLGPRQVFVQMQPEWGRPDGGAVDADGCYWGCGITAGRINKFSPQGQLLGYLPLPVSRPTMCAFGGSDLKTLYVTSLTENMSADELAQEPLAGALFAVSMSVAGTPVADFGI
jgi:sugar lactone lactonase YvrE